MADQLGPQSILVIDDRPDEPRSILRELGDLLEVIHPTELQPQHLENAHLVLVDHDLRNEDWPERIKEPLACQPLDGIALAHVLLGHLRSSEYIHFPPTAVGILSADLGLITPGFDSVPEHVAARTSGLHWAFWKSPHPIDSDEQPLPQRITQFASAIMKLPKGWTDGKQVEHLRMLLGVGSDPGWETIGINQALRCHPPIHELASWTSGLSIVRWLAQRILPYPSFLIGLDEFAVRLGVTPTWFRHQMIVDMPLERLFRSVEYKGILSRFLGRRWWVAGIDAEMHNAGPEVPYSRQLVSEWLKDLCGAVPELFPSNHTLILNERTIFSEGLTAPFDECVRLQLDDWPQFADDPWTTIELALSTERLRISIHPDDEGSVGNE